MMKKNSKYLSFLGLAAMYEMSMLSSYIDERETKEPTKDLEDRIRAKIRAKNTSK